MKMEPERARAGVGVTITDISLKLSPTRALSSFSAFTLPRLRFDFHSTLTFRTRCKFE